MIKPGFAALAVFALWATGCRFDDGFVSPQDARNLSVLEQYSGKTILGDSLSSARLIDLANPKVTILWRGIGLQDKFSSSNQSSIDIHPPYAFSLSILQPPAPDIVDASEIAFGIFCLYSDANGNGAFDRLMHPELRKTYGVIDSLIRESIPAKARLLAISERRPREPVTQTFFLDPSGTLLRQGQGRPDTMTVLTGTIDVNWARDYLTRYERILNDQNRWERFFGTRKKENEYFFRTFPAAGHLFGIELRFDRALFPKPGKEAEFAARLENYSAIMGAVHAVSSKSQEDAAQSAKLDYPFSGFGIPGEDWMAGRSILDVLLFLRTRATLDTMLAAAMTGSFRIAHLERLHTGYNLFRCDDQYACDVRGAEDSVVVYLGTTDAFFNAPSTPSRKPFKASPGAQGSPTVADGFKTWEGRYALNGSDTVSVAVWNSQLWCQTTNFGLIRVTPVDSQGFQSPVLDFQAALTHGVAPGLPDRLVEYFAGIRYVTLRLGEPVTTGLVSRISGASDFKRADIPDSALARCEGAYDFNGDTLRITPAGGDSLQAAIPGFKAMVFHAVNDSLFRCPWGEYSLEFQGPRAERFSRVIFGNGAAKKNVPNFSAFPSNLVKSDAREVYGIEWFDSSEGSGRDSYLGSDGLHRYSCSEDGRFLRAGDGSLSDLSRTDGTDAISLRRGGDYLTFRILGMKGKIGLAQLRSCAEGKTKSKRKRISIWGGSDSRNQHLLYGDHQWMEIDANGVYWTLDSLHIDDDPYYLTLKQEDTEAMPVYYGFDEYRIGLRP